MSLSETRGATTHWSFNVGTGIGSKFIWSATDEKPGAGTGCWSIWLDPRETRGAGKGWGFIWLDTTHSPDWYHSGGLRFLCDRLGASELRKFCKLWSGAGCSMTHSFLAAFCDWTMTSAFCRPHRAVFRGILIVLLLRFCTPQTTLAVDLALFTSISPGTINPQTPG